MYSYLEGIFSFAKEVAIPEVFTLLVFTSAVWIPFLIIDSAWKLWVKYVRYAWIAKQQTLLLEIRLPQETLKSPKAMELVLLSLYQTSGESTPIDRYWDGKVRVWFSLELASHGGDVHFYIWTFKNMRNILESAIYAQYPGVEIHEVKDYTEKIYFDPKKYDLSGCMFEATSPDPLPIKTYLDYELEKDPKEELKIDPMAPLIEFMGSLKEGHEAWVQIILRAHTEEKNIFNKKIPDKWKADAKKLIEDTIKEAEIIDKNGNKMSDLAKLTKGKTDKIASVEKNISKYAFDVGIRIAYIAPKDIFDKGNYGGLLGSFKQFNAPDKKGFKPMNGTGFDYFWQDFTGKKLLKRKVDTFNSYCLRSFFHYPYKEKWTVMTTEELATIYHFPGSAVSTPTLRRIPSKRSNAPVNLPI